MSGLDKKDKSIVDVVKRLRDKFGEQNFKIKDHWEADLFAIGLTDISEKHLIYFSNYGNGQGNYFVSLEDPSIDKQFPYEPAGKFNEVSLRELGEHFVRHLRIETIS